jgi:hypothetical protein
VCFNTYPVLKNVLSEKIYENSLIKSNILRYNTLLSRIFVTILEINLNLVLSLMSSSDKGEVILHIKRHIIFFFYFCHTLGNHMQDNRLIFSISSYNRKIIITFHFISIFFFFLYPYHLLT